MHMYVCISECARICDLPPGQSCLCSTCLHSPPLLARGPFTLPSQEHVTAWLYPPQPIWVLHPKGNTGCDNRVSCRSCEKSAACSFLTGLVYWCTLAELGSVSLNTSARIWWVGPLCMQKAERALWAINRGFFFLFFLELAVFRMFVLVCSGFLCCLVKTNTCVPLHLKWNHSVHKAVLY